MASDSLDKHFKEILEKLDSIIVMLEDLLEDPIFLDTIHGEDEMSLDLALELLDRISVKFEPTSMIPQDHRIHIDDSFDVD